MITPTPETDTIPSPDHSCSFVVEPLEGAYIMLWLLQCHGWVLTALFFSTIFKMSPASQELLMFIASAFDDERQMYKLV